MNIQEKKKALALTDIQAAIVNEMNDVFRKAKEADIEIIYDSAEYSFAAVNKQNVAEFKNWNVQSEKAEDIENCVEWGNILCDIFNYDSHYENLHAIFK